MNWLGVCVFVFICGPLLAANLPLKPKECSVGPTYWCQNITTAAGCGAVKHCIQTVWEQQTPPEDHDNVCDICLDMVTQARDQLESNETQDELKQVFEGSCKLILLKPIVEECVKLADEFIPELVETLASQMNPQMVCSVAGLCNSARIDEMLAKVEVTVHAAKLVPATAIAATAAASDSCSDCQVVARALKDKFERTPRDDFLNNMIELCGRLGSFSDGCAAVAITHFNAIYNHLQSHLDAQQVCHLAGTCDAMFHTHEKPVAVEVVHESTTGVVRPPGGKTAAGDDLPCELCEKLVAHLQDILVANTTEAEFLQVMEGLCKQTGSFKGECLSIVRQYYGMIYNYLVKALVPSETCALAGLCPNPGKKVVAPANLWPLLPPGASDKVQAIKLQASQTVIPATPLIRVAIGNNGAKVSSLQIQLPQLPPSRLMPQAVIGNAATCTMCEYFLHYLQTAITNPAEESHIEEVVREACDHLPRSIEGPCREFVTTYGDAVVALLAQEIDPSQLCPQLGLCPSLTIVDIDRPAVHDKASCPLCLFAVQELTTKLQDNKTEESIKEALDSLCTHLPKSLIGECKEFVTTYEEQLVDMLIADFTPQEVCVYLRLCDDQTFTTTTTTVAPDILSNEIPQLRTVSKVADSSECVICEFVLTKIDSMLKNQSTEAEIKQVVHNVCNKLPQTVGKECNDFVTQYADLVITLLAQTLDPKEVCSEIKLCTPTRYYKKKQYTKSIEGCMVCEATLGALEGLLDDPTVEKEVGEKLGKACNALPAAKQEQCRQMVAVYGPSIINLVTQLFGGRRVCQKIGLCEDYVPNKVELLGGKKCTWGPGYWCQSEGHAQSCGATKHCQDKVWLGARPTLGKN